MSDLTQRLSPSYGRVQSLSLSVLCVCVCVCVSCVRGFAVCAPARLPHCTVLSARPDRQIWCARSQPPYPVGSQSAARLEHVQPPCWTQTHLISYIRHRPRGSGGVDPPTKLEFRRRALQPSLRDHLTSLLIARIHRHASPIVTSLIISLRAYKNHQNEATPRSELSRRANTAPPSLVCAVPSGPDPVLGVKNVRWLPGVALGVG